MLIQHTGFRACAAKRTAWRDQHFQPVHIIFVVFRILAFLTKGQALMTGTLTMLLLVPPLLVTDWLQQYLGVY